MVHVDEGVHHLPRGGLVQHGSNLDEVEPLRPARSLPLRPRRVLDGHQSSGRLRLGEVGSGSIADQRQGV